MTMLPLLLSVALLPQGVAVAQIPATGQPAAAAATDAAAAGAPADGRLDQVELTSGEVLEGRIVLERGSYLEIELEPGATVGFRRTEVAAIRRGAGAPVPTAIPAAAAANDAWFTLYDGAGVPVGWLHSTRTPTADGSLRLLEEWEFADGPRWYQLTTLETTDAALQPRSCYFRERVRENTAVGVAADPMARRTRVRAERIVEATVDGAVLHVQRLMPDGRSERDLPWPQGATFPLLARLRQHAADVEGDTEVTVFDAGVEELRTRTFAAARQRRVVVDGVPTVVTESVEAGDAGSNAVWRDASARVLRREIAGPALVAVPATAEAAQRAVGIGADHRAAVPAAFVAEADHRFGLWLPNPAWDAQPPQAGSVTLRCGVHGAAITLAALDQLDAAATLDAAAAAVERWFLLMHPEYEAGQRSWPQLRAGLSARLQFAGGTGLDRTRAELLVVPWQAGFVVLQCTAPTRAWDELAADFERVAARLELVPAAVAQLCGPDRAGPTSTVPSSTVPSSTAPISVAPSGIPTPQVAPPAAPGRVRVPTQDGDQK